MNKDIPIEVMALLNYGVKPFFEKLGGPGWSNRILKVKEEYSWPDGRPVMFPNGPFDIPEIDIFVEEDPIYFGDVMGGLLVQHQAYTAMGWISRKIAVERKTPGCQARYEFKCGGLDEQDIGRIYGRMELMKTCIACQNNDVIRFGAMELRSYLDTWGEEDYTTRAVEFICREFEYDLETTGVSQPLEVFCTNMDRVKDILSVSTEKGFNTLTMTVLRLKPTNEKPVSMRL